MHTAAHGRRTSRLSCLLRTVSQQSATQVVSPAVTSSSSPPDWLAGWLASSIDLLLATAAHGKWGCKIITIKENGRPSSSTRLFFFSRPVSHSVGRTVGRTGPGALIPILNCIQGERERETAVVPTDVRSQVGRQKAIDRQAGGSTWTAKMRSLSLTQCTCVWRLCALACTNLNEPTNE